MQLLQTRRTPTRSRGGNNGGFPVPPKGEPAHVVHCSHQTCGAQTRVRLPKAIPAEAVHQVVCDGCREPFGITAGTGAVGSQGSDPAGAIVADQPTAPITAATGSPRAAIDALAATAAGIGGGIRDRLDSTGLALPSMPDISSTRAWAWASVPLALLGVIVGLSLIQGSDPAAQPSAAAAADASAPAPGDAEFVSEPGYSLALPDGWKQTNPPEGAVFAAESPDGTADATLWIEEAPDLSFKKFEQRSLAQLGDLADNARVVDRVEGPTLESTIVELGADPPAATGGTDSYRVTLRGAGRFRLYLGTLAQGGADPETLGQIELLHGSLRPEVKRDGTGGG